MKNFVESFYEILISKEKFYMKQYYSKFHRKDKFLSIKELQDGIYCVLISNDKWEEIDCSEAIEYLKTLEKPFSLNVVVLSPNKDIHTENSSIVHKLIINEENYNVIACDKSCLPLKQVIEYVINENNIEKTNDKVNFLKYKIPTLILILINIIMFIITQIKIHNLNVAEINNILSAYQGNFSSTDIADILNNSVLTSLGAKDNILIEQGQVWRLLTCAFLHANLVHIACNMYSLYIIGPQIQQIYRTKKYLCIYIISCITSSLLSYFMNPNSISVGASGGIFGLMGALLAFAIVERHRLEKKYISSLIQIIVLNLFIGLSIANIDNFGHLGGLIGGLFIGYIIYVTSKKKHR